MGMRIGLNSSARKVITIKNRDGSVAGSISISSPKKKSTKKLHYNYKQVSRAIMAAKTSNTASKVVTKARTVIAQLLRKMHSNEYDDEEIEAAVIHAKKMERIAKKKVKHLEQEEEAKQKGTAMAEEDVEAPEKEEFDETEEERLSKEDLEALMREFQELMEEELEDMEKAAVEELAEEMLLNASVREMSPDELENFKRKHRSDELREIAEADMKYLKALFNKYQREKEELSNGVSLELLGFEMPVEVTEIPVSVEGGSVDMSL